MNIQADANKRELDETDNLIHQIIIVFFQSLLGDMERVSSLFCLQNVGYHSRDSDGELRKKTHFKGDTLSSTMVEPSSPSMPK